jgi:DUF1009 family protein
VRRAAGAGLRGIAIGARTTLVLEREKTVESADAAGLFLFAIDPDIDIDTGRRP